MNKKVLITGSTKGIGKAIVEKFHSQNWDVGIVARDKNAIHEFTNTLNLQRKESAYGIGVDLSSTEENLYLKKRIEQDLKELDCIVFNVGSGKGERGLNATSDDNLKLLRINYLDVAKSLRILLPLVRKNTNSSIIFIGSIAQEKNVQAPIAYAYAKRALNIFVSALALELASQKISVNLVNPGHIFTEDGVWGNKMKNSQIEFEEFIIKNVPLGSIGQVNYVAEIIFNLTDHEYRKFLTGARINLDGGTSLVI